MSAERCVQRRRRWRISNFVPNSLVEATSHELPATLVQGYQGLADFAKKRRRGVAIASPLLSALSPRSILSHTLFIVVMGYAATLCA